VHCGVAGPHPARRSDPCTLADHEDVRLITLLGGPIRTMSVDSLSLGR
jgi:hypothetical protein